MIKKFIKFLCFGIILVIQSTPVQAQYTYKEYWEVSDFHSDIKINESGTVHITENIKADFSNEAHRGLARLIPFKYQLNKNKSYNAHIEFISGRDENDISWDNTVYRDGNELVIEMRTHDYSEINESAVFNIKYLAKRVINYFDNEDEEYPHEEFYWNVNGTEWVVPIKNISTTVTFPRKIPAEDLKFECFTGKYGELNKDCEWKLSKNKVTFKATKELAPYENLSIVVGMPLGTIEAIPVSQQVKWFIEDYWKIFLPLILPILVFMFMYGFWYVRGRDAKVARDIIMPHYKPPKNLSATECGTIIDEKLHPRDITSTIIDYAIKGYIQITELKKGKDFELKLLKAYDTDKSFEKLILKGVFEKNKPGEATKISELKNKFYKNLPGIRKNIMSSVVKQGYFPHNPGKIRRIYSTIGGLLIFGPLFTGAAAYSLGFFLATILSGIIIVIFGQFMPRKTVKGTETYFHLKGLYEYIDTAEKDRIAYQEKANIFFEKLLPYAMAFGLAKKWAKAFDGLITSPPEWYNSRSGNSFNMVHFANSLSGLSRKTTRNMASRPGSAGKSGSWGGSSGFSGGGFSGGGFGGGGGRGL